MYAVHCVEVFPAYSRGLPGSQMKADGVKDKLPLHAVFGIGQTGIGAMTRR